MRSTWNFIRTGDAQISPTHARRFRFSHPQTWGRLPACAGLLVPHPLIGDALHMEFCSHWRCADFSDARSPLSILSPADVGQAPSLRGTLSPASVDRRCAPHGILFALAMRRFLRRTLAAFDSLTRQTWGRLPACAGLLVPHPLIGDALHMEFYSHWRCADFSDARSPLSILSPGRRGAGSQPARDS